MEDIMGIALLKKLNTHLPDSVKIAFGPIIRSKLINNTVFKAQMDRLYQMDIQTAEEIEKAKLVSLKEILIHAYEHTKYYKILFDKCGFDVYSFKDLKEFEKIPVLKKSDIIENFQELQADNINDYYSATTGGSTGSPLKILLDRESIYKEKAFIYHFWEKHGYDYKSSKLASFRGTDFGGKICKTNPLYNEIQLNPCNINADTIEEYYNKMNKFGVEFLHGFPSAIYSFCKFAKEAKLDVKSKYKAAFFISENVYDYQRKFIEEVLGLKTFAFYGHSERAVFAEQVSEEGYQFNPAYCFWELSKDGSDNIICTGFINRKMPLIRYELDDTAVKIGNIYKIEGHRDGVIYGRNGEIISAAMLEVHSTILDKIANYQFVQNETDVLKVLAVPFKHLSKEELNSVRELFQTKVGDAVRVEAEEVEEIQLTQRGKFKLIVQNCK